MSDEDATGRAQDLTPNREALRALSVKLRDCRERDEIGALMPDEARWKALEENFPPPQSWYEEAAILLALPIQ